MAMFFNKEYSNYLKDVMKKNEDKIHSFNYKYIHEDLLFRRIDENDYSIRANVSNVIDHINHKIKITFLFKHEIGDYIYDIITNLLRSELQFNIDKFTEERYFINIIMASFFEDYSFNWEDDSDNFKEQINYSKDFLSNLFDILYDYDESIFSDYGYKSNLELKESTKNNINLLFDIIVDSTLKGYKRSDNSMIIFEYSEMEFNNLKFELLSKYHKEKAIEEYKITQELKHLEEKSFKETPIKEDENKKVKLIKKIDNIQITAIHSNLTKQKVNFLIKGLIKLQCIDDNSSKDLLAFFGINKSKDNIQSIKWRKSKILCAYFVDKFNTDILKNDRIVWKPFEVLFSQNNLNGSRNHYKNKTSVLPAGHKEIDKIFDKLISV